MIKITLNGIILKVLIKPTQWVYCYSVTRAQLLFDQGHLRLRKGIECYWCGEWRGGQSKV
jgi:hypothetical protein